jgi:ribosomal protein S12 methylthiotransferase accessory factor YcaO
MDDAARVFAKLTSSTAKYFRGGTHRTVSPEITVERLRPFMARMGITRVANVTGLDRIGVPVVTVCRPNSRALAVTQGKGADLASAKASGLMEAVESYHAERISLPLKLGSYKDLCSSHRMVDVTQLYRTSRSIFHPDLPILWIEGYDLLHQEIIWLPYDLVHLNYTVAIRSLPECFLSSSNGLASGNHFLEAVSQGICEVVERDATTLWRLLSKERWDATRIDLSTVHDPLCRDVLEKFERAEAEQNPLHRLSGAGGMGCHPAKQVALLRALTEAAQSRLTLITGSRDDMPRGKYLSTSNPDSTRLQYLLLAPGRVLRDYDNIPTFEGQTFEADVAWELECLRSAGIERVIVVDLSHAEFGVSVVRVVIPGLEMLADSRPGYVLGARGKVALEQCKMLPAWSTSR